MTFLFLGVLLERGCQEVLFYLLFLSNKNSTPRSASLAHRMPYFSFFCRQVLAYVFFFESKWANVFGRDLMQCIKWTLKVPFRTSSFKALMWLKCNSRIFSPFILLKCVDFFAVFVDVTNCISLCLSLPFLYTEIVALYVGQNPVAISTCLSIYLKLDTSTGLKSSSSFWLAIPLCRKIQSF